MIQCNSNSAFRLSFAVLAALMIAASASTSSTAANCTDGVNCYCDKAANPAHPLYDPNALICEDFEAATLYEDLGTGNKTNAGGQNIWGSWYDRYNDGHPWDRGNNSYWVRVWGQGGISDSAAIPHGQPVSSQRGQTCNVPGYRTCWSAKEWHPRNLWDSNSGAFIDIQRNGDARLEVPSIGDVGIHDGTQILAYRNEAGFGDQAAGGFIGSRSLTCTGGGCTEIGLTTAMAYASNSQISGIWKGPWKHEEWGSSRAISTFVHGNVGAGGPSQNPYRPAIMMKEPYSLSACQAVVAGATVNRGQMSCNGVALQFAADPSYYDQARDWPWGTWACTQGHIKGLGTTNGSLKFWHSGTLILDITNIDFTKAYDQSWRIVGLNNFANTNDPASGGTIPTNQTTYRYLDNFHVRNGPPVSCSAIGFGGDVPPNPPSPPAAPIRLD